MEHQLWKRYGATLWEISNDYADMEHQEIVWWLGRFAERSQKSKLLCCPSGRILRSPVKFEPRQGMAIDQIYLTDYLNQTWFVIVVADSVAHNVHPQRVES